MKLLQALQKLKEGIETSNQSLIEESYILLTGEEISFPVVSTASVPIEETYTPEPENVQLLDMEFAMNLNKVESEKKEFVNNFDPGLDEDKEDGYNTVDDDIKPVERKRKPYTDVEVFCQDCKKNITIHPQFKRDPYHCELIKLGEKCPNSK
jgi:hypothetical protein